MSAMDDDDDEACPCPSLGLCDGPEPERPPMPDITASPLLDYRVSFVLALIGIVFIAVLDPLAKAGFAKPGSTSISAYIETPGATGAMAVATAPSLMSMRELEKYLAQLMMHQRLGNEDDDHRFSLNTTIALRTTSFWLFMVCYGGFLICNVSAYEAEHYAFVGLFAVAFLFHAILRIFDTAAWTSNDDAVTNRRSIPAAIVIFIGCAAFAFMVAIQYELQSDDAPRWIELFVDHKGFYIIEVVGFSALLLFTPFDLWALGPRVKPPDAGPPKLG